MLRIIEDHQLLSNPVAAIRHAAADLLDRHPFPELVARLRPALLGETVGMVSEAQVRALRCIGGEAAFDALLEAAHDAHLPSARSLASRALAWVRGYPDADTRVRALCRSKDSRSRAIGATALSEAKYHSVHAYGGVLASREERAAAPAEA